MNIVFFGTSEFAIEPLEALIASRHKVLALVTQPDRERGRNLKLSPPMTKVLALSKGIPVYQPEDASNVDSVSYLKDLHADLFVVIAFGQILRKGVLEIPNIYAINLHGSLLPKYRGAAPINWAVINGEMLSGITIIKMNERMDEGDIILKRETGIDPEDTNITLSEKLSSLGAKALLEAIDIIEKKAAAPEKQDGSKATYAAKLKKEDGLIDWNEPAAVIHNKVRGLLPWPGAYTHYDGKILKILKTEVVDAAGDDLETGVVVDIFKDRGIVVRTGSGDLLIQFLQLEGKKDMDADSFVRGHEVRRGYKFK